MYFKADDNSKDPLKISVACPKGGFLNIKTQDKTRKCHKCAKQVERDERYDCGAKHGNERC